ncbi:hypothetical protein M885DRAFT_625906 [Pelagophyceae sp. CCMP2097]|nr:hypothetical protein M885DRAFT_625906 [Pelagophyceae sp. CCMP2097]
MAWRWALLLWCSSFAGGEVLDVVFDGAAAPLSYECGVDLAELARKWANANPRASGAGCDSEACIADVIHRALAGRCGVAYAAAAHAPRRADRDDAPADADANAATYAASPQHTASPPADDAPLAAGAAPLAAGAALPATHEAPPTTDEAPLAVDETQLADEAPPAADEAPPADEALPATEEAPLATDEDRRRPDAAAVAQGEPAAANHGRWRAAVWALAAPRREALWALFALAQSLALAAVLLSRGAPERAAPKEPQRFAQTHKEPRRGAAAAEPAEVGASRGAVPAAEMAAPRSPPASPARRRPLPGAPPSNAPLPLPARVWKTATPRRRSSALPQSLDRPRLPSRPPPAAAPGSAAAPGPGEPGRRRATSLWPADARFAAARPGSAAHCDAWRATWAASSAVASPPESGAAPAAEAHAADFERWYAATFSAAAQRQARDVDEDNADIDAAEEILRDATADVRRAEAQIRGLR